MQAENEIVHIQEIPNTTFEIFHQDFSNRKLVIFIAKGNSSSYNIVAQNISPPADSKVFHWFECFKSRTNRS